MTATINAHVRRNDAYHDWFSVENDGIVRRMIDNPQVIEFVPAEFGLTIRHGRRDCSSNA
ncbi:hypothetical protein [Mycobacterium sp.]|uniref:hypothetical protein n=1 Tax=Mycobacterium sp. TaxID=1785 RepID=UPI0025F2C12D|nr:hypothetical protein [Mycobacterium sp.]MBW0015202.1 hypothetical protein [Mycobacterium sp.]